MPITRVPPTTSERTILIVDGDVQARAVVGVVLRAHGYRVLEARDEDEALLISDRTEGEIDLLITAAIHASMTGPRLAEQVARHHPEVGIVILADPSEATGTEPSGRRVIVKPLAISPLLECLRSLLDSR